jgi:hypothetical protein
MLQGDLKNSLIYTHERGVVQVSSCLLTNIGSNVISSNDNSWDKIVPTIVS